MLGRGEIVRAGPHGPMGPCLRVGDREDAVLPNEEEIPLSKELNDQPEMSRIPPTGFEFQKSFPPGLRHAGEGGAGQAAPELLGQSAQFLRVGPCLPAQRGVTARSEEQRPLSLPGAPKRHLPGVRRDVEHLIDEEMARRPDLSYEGERVEGREPVLGRCSLGGGHVLLESG